MCDCFFCLTVWLMRLRQGIDLGVRLHLFECLCFCLYVILYSHAFIWRIVCVWFCACVFVCVSVSVYVGLGVSLCLSASILLSYVCVCVFVRVLLSLSAFTFVFSVCTGRKLHVVVKACWIIGARVFYVLINFSYSRTHIARVLSYA